MPLSRRILFIILASLAFAQAQTLLVDRESFWRYRADGADLGIDWCAPEYPDATWSPGFAPFGYGGDEETTLVPPPGTVTTYFRRHFYVADPTAYLSLTLRIRRDDAAVVWLNGELVFFADFQGGPPGAGVPAELSISGPAENEFIELSLAPDVLIAGDNVFAVEIHQAADAEDDHIFDLELLTQHAPALTRGPYLQQATPTGITVRWRTATPVVGRVRFRPTPNDIPQVVAESTPTTEHVIALTGLAPATRYYYAIEDESSVLAGGTAEDYFETHPIAGTVAPVRVWILGDSGTGGVAARKVADAYKNSPHFKHPDVWLMLGDNAYGSGYDNEYQVAVFDMYPDFLRNTTLWPTIGNHDTYNLLNPIPYLEIFELPKNGEAGGVPSGSEHYYSFDYANVHFICLDSQTESILNGAPMMEWLEADLAATSQKWLVAFWHHPPYSKGSHDTDLELYHGEIRAQILPILEAAGVDLVLTGHSHNYERSCLLDGHYGLSTTLLPSMKLNPGLGRFGEGGPYLKAPGPHNGVVYTVAGHSGQVNFAPLDHPVNVVNWNLMGSLFLDFNGDRMDARMIDIDGVIRDSFTIEKVSPVAIPPLPLQPTPHDSWRIAKFTDSANTADIAGDLADPDRDEIPNLIERAFGLDPIVFSTHGLPVAANGVAAITFRRPAATADLRYIVQFSTDLIHWTDGSSYHGAAIVPHTAVTRQVSLTPGDPEIITVRATAPGAGFLRLAVRRN